MEVDMDINMDDPNWRVMFRLISEHQLMGLQESLDRKNPTVKRGELALIKIRQPVISFHSETNQPVLI
jgi:hypothetical protein